MSHDHVGGIAGIRRVGVDHDRDPEPHPRNQLHIGQIPAGAPSVTHDDGIRTGVDEEPVSVVATVVPVGRLVRLRHRRARKQSLQIRAQVVGPGPEASNRLIPLSNVVRGSQPLGPGLAERVGAGQRHGAVHRRTGHAQWLEDPCADSFGERGVLDHGCDQTRQLEVAIRVVEDHTRLRPKGLVRVEREAVAQGGRVGEWLGFPVAEARGLCQQVRNPHRLGHVGSTDSEVRDVHRDGVL